MPLRCVLPIFSPLVHHRGRENRVIFPSYFIVVNYWRTFNIFTRLAETVSKKSTHDSLVFAGRKLNNDEKHVDVLALRRHATQE